MALTDEAILRIKELIVSGELRPGERLPREADLAGQLGLSRNSLREAVRALSLINILDVRHGDGTYVTSLAPEVLLDALTFVVDFHQDDSVLEFLRVRRILEPAAAAMAAQHITAEQIADLQNEVDASQPQAGPEDMLRHDVEFHRLIGLATGNSVLASFVDGLSAPTNRARLWRGSTEQGAQERTAASTETIVDAIAAREPDRAHAAMLMHVSGVEEWLRKAREVTR